MKFLIACLVAAVLNVNGAIIMKLVNNEVTNNATINSSGFIKERNCRVEQIDDKFMMLCTVKIATEVKDITPIQGTDFVQFEVRREMRALFLWL